VGIVKRISGKLVPVLETSGERFLGPSFLLARPVINDWLYAWSSAIISFRVFLKSSMSLLRIADL
jgi:hypothetical protein